MSNNDFISALSTNSSPADNGQYDQTLQKPTSVSSRLIDDPDGAKDKALGDALAQLIQNGIPKQKKTLVEFLLPHRASLIKLHNNGASYAAIAHSLSDELNLKISAKAVNTVIKYKKKGRANGVNGVNESSSNDR